MGLDPQGEEAQKELAPEKLKSLTRNRRIFSKRL